MPTMEEVAKQSLETEFVTDLTETISGRIRCPELRTPERRRMQDRV